MSIRLSYFSLHDLEFSSSFLLSDFYPGVSFADQQFYSQVLSGICSLIIILQITIFFLGILKFIAATGNSQIDAQAFHLHPRKYMPL